MRLNRNKEKKRGKLFWIIEKILTFAAQTLP